MKAIRAIKRRVRETRSAIRYIWWRWSNERDRVTQERDEARAAAEFRFRQMKDAHHAVYMLKADNLPASGDTLRRVADQIDCGPHCESVSPMDWSTGVRECHLSDRGECPFDHACELRDLATALDTHARLNASPTENGASGNE